MIVLFPRIVILKCFSLSEVTIGFEQIGYSVVEGAGVVNLRIGVLQGSLAGTNVAVELSTIQGSATGQFVCRVSCKDQLILSGDFKAIARMLYV